MECDVCGRAYNAQKLPFLCAVDARNQLYEPRFTHAAALLQRDELEKHANSALASPRQQLGSHRAQQQLAADETAQIAAQVERLRAEVEAARQEVAARRQALDQRRADLAAATSGVDERRSRQLNDIDKAVLQLRYRWRRVAETTASNRAYLCTVAARLYGLRRVKKGSVTRYEIGYVEIIELLGMNSASPELISTCLANIAHILVLASTYLGIRLPAEITLPHRDYPRPTIFSLSSSYQHSDIPFPSTGNMHLHVPSPRDAEPRSLPRPRPLFVDKPLPTLAKEDPAAYSRFVEGVTLLAYDIAWACCSQGIAIGEKDEDVCNMGQNLYRLLIGNQLHSNPAAQLFVASTGAAAAADDSDEGNNNPRPTTLVDAGKTKNLMGWHSHATAHAFLGSAQGSEFVRGFKLPNPMRLADPLKKRLISEAPMHEWETIETDDAPLDDEPEDEEGDGILIKGRKRRGSAKRQSDVEGAATGIDAVGAADTATTDGGGGKIPTSPKAGSEKPRMLGGNGWTKLKPR